MYKLRYKAVSIILVSFVLPILSFSLACLSARAEQVSVGKIQFSQTNFEFGQVAQGQLVEKEFKFKNIGNAELKITRVVSTCGCTAAVSSLEPVLPGAEGAIKVAFDSDGFSGKVKKMVRVHTTDSDNPEVTLTLEGTVEAVVQLLPQKISFPEFVTGAAPKEQLLEIRIKNSASKSIKSVNSFSKFLAVKQQSVTKDPSGQFTSYLYEVQLSPDILEGPFRDRIVVEIAGSGKSSFINVPVTAQVQSAISIEPQQISFGLIDSKQPISRSIKIQAKSDKSFDIKDVSSDLTAIELDTKVIEASKTFVINVKLKPDLIKSDFRGLIKVKTTDNEKPELFISVFGVVPPRQDH